VTVGRETGRRDRLVVIALLDFGIGRPVRNVDLEFD
jgi:hypothetical protein